MNNDGNKTEQSKETKKIDTGLHCLVMVAGYHGLAVDPEQLRHTLALGSEGMNTRDILRAARAGAEGKRGLFSLPIANP